MTAANSFDAVTRNGITPNCQRQNQNSNIRVFEDTVDFFCRILTMANDAQPTVTLINILFSVENNEQTGKSINSSPGIIHPIIALPYKIDVRKRNVVAR